MVLLNRPPPVTVDDDHIVRCDLHSNDVQITYPNLPTSTQWDRHREYVAARAAHLAMCDIAAYHKICDKFPHFCPPRYKCER